VKLRDWRSIFLFLFAYSALLVWYCYRNLPETLPPSKRQPFSPQSLARSYWRVFTSPIFQLKAGVVAFNFAGLFLYVAAAPVFLTEHLHLGPDQFAWQFVPTVAGIFLGALAANRLAGRIPMPTHVAIGFVFLAGATLANVLYHAFFPPALPWSVLPLLFYGFGFSVVAPVVTNLVMDLFPTMKGLVSSCQSFTQTMLGAAVAGVLAPSLSHDPLWLAAGQLACVAVSLTLWMIGISMHQRRQRQEQDVNAWETVPLE
jgi:DHA1 family bicyclomycin/chloramphenicol resistance-like MFS transporter